MAAARRGLFYGVWLGGVFGLFRNHVASLREQAQLAEEDERLAQVITAFVEGPGQQEMARATPLRIFRRNITFAAVDLDPPLLYALACVASSSSLTNASCTLLYAPTKMVRFIF